MALVYKYFPTDRRGFFKDPKFRLSNPADLNDPMDCIPSIDLVDVERRVQEIVDRNRAAIRARYGAMAEAVIQQTADKYKQQLMVNKEPFLNKVLDIHRRHINEAIGILSLSKVSDVELMWAHYCEDHKGFVIGLDSNSAFFKRKPSDTPDVGELADVHYSSTPIQILVDDYRIPVELLYSKKSIWAYEQEVRIVRELQNGDEDIVVKGKHIHFFVFPKEDIREVIFGFNSPDDLIADITQDINADAAYQITFKRAGYDPKGNFVIANHP